MRKILAAATFGLVLGVAGASNPADQTPEARAYLGFSFGGERAVPRDFHYGLRLDHDSRFVERQLPPLMQFDFTRAGLNAARVNGMSVVKQQYRVHQAEEPAAEQPAEQPAEVPAEGAEAAPAEEPGFFSKTWSGITGFFGGGDEEEAPAEETAEAEPSEEAAPAGEEVTEGMFLGYNVVDWGLLAAGAVGLGFAVSEVSNSDDSGDPGTASPPDPGITPDPGDQIPTILPANLTYGDRRGAFDFLPVERNMSPEYQTWLDGGTGHMGDLGVQD